MSSPFVSQKFAEARDAFLRAAEAHQAARGTLRANETYKALQRAARAYQGVLPAGRATDAFRLEWRSYERDGGWNHLAQMVESVRGDEFLDLAG